MAFILSWITSLLYELFNWFGLSASPEYDVIVVGYVVACLSYLGNFTHQARIDGLCVR